jgi:hypothetical protein
MKKWLLKVVRLDDYEYFNVKLMLIVYSIPKCIHLFIRQWLYSPLLDLGRFFSFLIFYRVARTPWTGDQPVARPLRAHTRQHKHRINAHRQPYLKWGSNP